MPKSTRAPDKLTILSISGWFENFYVINNHIVA